MKYAINIATPVILVGRSSFVTAATRDNVPRVTKGAAVIWRVGVAGRGEVTDTKKQTSC